mgnify:CR=1 FL=1
MKIKVTSFDVLFKNYHIIFYYFSHYIADALNSNFLNIQREFLKMVVPRNSRIGRVFTPRLSVACE